MSRNLFRFCCPWPAARERFFWLGGHFIKTSVQNAEDIKARKTLIEFEH